MRFIQLLAIFVLPFLLYAGYFLYLRHRAQQQGQNTPRWEDGPWYWLALAGVILVIIAIVVLNSFDASEPQRLVVPPRLGD